METTPAPLSSSWAVHCGRCESWLVAHDHVEFLQENERAIHLGLRRHQFDETHESGRERTLRSKLHPQTVSFTKMPQSHAAKLVRSPFTLLCPVCQIKIGSEVAMPGWPRSEYLFDTKMCRVSIHSSDGAVGPERLHYRKHVQLLAVLIERNLDTYVRSPTPSVDSTDESDNEDDQQLSARPPKRIKKREKVAAAMVWPTEETVRELLSHSSKHTKLSTLRDYQLELVLGSLLENSIIYLPTGCGKTLVAVRVMSVFKHLNPHRKAAFLVPTGPLVNQQASYLRRESDLTVVELSGQNAAAGDPRKRREAVAHTDALVATPQFFENMLSDHELVLDQFCVLVFDEAHHATGDSPYCDVLKRIAGIATERRPRILALTASPFGQRVTTLSMENNKVLRGLCFAYNAKLNTPTIATSLSQLSSVFKQVHFETIEQAPHAQQLQQTICRHVRSLTEILCSLSDDGSMIHLDGSLLREGRDGDEDDCESNEDIYVLCGKLRKLQVRLCGDSPADKNYRHDIANVLVHLRRILMVLPQMAIHSPRYLADLLREYFLRVETTEPQLYELVKSLYDEDVGPALDRLLDTPTTGQWQDIVSLKVQAVARIVTESFVDRDSRAIVFVRRRKTALWLAEVMDKVPVLRQLNPTRFIGHNSYEGMTWEEEQRPTLERFRRGRIRMLVATSVLEEGLDVPECSLVIQFDGVVGMTSLVQSRGRARQSEGRFIVMCGEKKQKELETMIESEVAMLEMARAQADTMESKATTRRMMDELARDDASEPAQEPQPTESSLDERTVQDWSQIDNKLCIMFGIMTPSQRQELAQSNILAVLQAINDCGCVEIDQADTRLGLLALEASNFDLHDSDYAALYDEMCRRLTFRVDGDGREDATASQRSFWIKMVSAVSANARVDDLAHLINGVLVEEPSDSFLRCSNMLQGRLRRQDTFELWQGCAFEDHITQLAKRSSLLVLQDGRVQQYEFDLLAVDNRTVWIETRSTNEWILLFTLRHAPKISWVEDTSRDCRDFHFKPLTFALCVYATSADALRSMRNALIEEGLDVRDTKINFVAQSTVEAFQPVQIPSIHEPSPDPTMLSFALASLVSTWCFALGGHVPLRILDMLRKLDTDALRIQVMLHFQPTATTEDALVDEFRSYIERQYPALKGLVKLQQRLILKAIVTPTRILFERPDVAPPNRVFRHFDPENFLYVYFRDESQERLDFDGGPLADRVRDVMQNGIRIGDSHFKFLGCSLSQLRNANCVFTVLDPYQVRQWMGDLHNIKPAAKYLKRLGQAFSSTRESITIHPQVLLTPENDIRDSTGRYEFTDGCGEITRRAAVCVARTLRINPVPSAFQIRLGGAKGVLVVSDFVPVGDGESVIDEDVNDLEEDDGDCGVRLRKSMVKFPSPHNKLEIVAVASAHSVAYLSRQSILILSDLGIDDEVFTTLQDEFMLSLASMLVSDFLGLQEIRASVPPDQIWWIDVLYNAVARDLLKIDPYHRRIVHAIYQYKLANTVLRARIPVAKGRSLMGVADFTGTLDYGEVFVQYTERDPSGENDLERVITLENIDVLVHRSPCHHPGDLRVLRCRGAKNVPLALSQLRDCIVFPVRGPRPHPDECTGGDLDGDTFTVIWDERLIPPRDHIMPAMTLAEETPSPEDTLPVDVPRLIEFYLFALQHDILGMASNAHMAVCDSSKDGCFDTHALVLADVCSREVDCCKNPAYFKLVQKLMPHQYPDFLQNTGKPSYKSPKVLGKLYRRALALQSYTAPNFGGAIANDVDESYLTDGYLKYTRVARLIYQQYKYAVRMVLQSCGAVSEAELATGMVIELASEYKAEYFRYGERSRDVFYGTQRTFRDQFEKAYGSKTDHVRRRVAAAWYVVAYRDTSDDRLLSFPWILADLLIMNKNLRTNITSKDGVFELLPVGGEASAVMELVTSQLQLSLLNDLEGRFGALLTAYHERLQAVTSLRIALSPHFDDQDVGCVLFGSSAMLTFEAQSDLDVVLVPITTTQHLKDLARFAASAECVTAVQLRERTHVPVLSLALDEVWTVEISTTSTGPRKTAWFRAYMVEYAFFWPAAFCLIKWGKAAGLIRRRSIAGSSTGRSMFLPVGFLWLFLDFCIQHKFVEPLECPDHGLEPVETEIEMSFWSALLHRTLQSSREPTAARVVLAFFRYFGDLETPLSAFGFTDPLDAHNNTTLTAEHTEIFREQCYVAHHQLVVSNGDLVSLVRQQQDHRRRITLSRALSKHVHRSPDFFAAKILRESGVQPKDASLAFAHHPNALRPDLYVADVVGNGDAVHRIEQKIEKIEEQLGAPQVHRPTEGVHRSGCCLLLLEGATQQSEKVAFQRYFDARHAQHETLELHQVHLVNFSNGQQWLEHAVGSFTTKFMRQMVKLTHFEKLNPGVARSKAIVRFGHHYLINLPWSFHEESISLATIEMLEREFERGREARELYESVLVARQRDRKNAGSADDNEGHDDEAWLQKQKRKLTEKRTRLGAEDGDNEGSCAGGGGSGGDRHGHDDGDGGGGWCAASEQSPSDKDTIAPKRKPLLALGKASAMTSRDRGVAHSFYPMIAPHDAHRLHDFAAKRKHMRVVAQSESFQVSIVRDSFEFNVRLTPELQLVKVKTRATRWLSATLKMRQELVDDRSRMDATPDVRLYVSGSEDVPSSDPLPQMLERACAKAPHGRGVLQLMDQSQDGETETPRVRVASELLAEGIELREIVNVRHMQCTTYQSPHDGVELRVLNVVEFAVPKPDARDGFVHETRKTECEMVLPPLTADVRVDAAFARRFLLAGVELVEFLREHMRHGLDAEESC